MTTTQQIQLFHFTHVANLPSLVEHGLQCDSEVRRLQRLRVEVAETQIKEHRRKRPVPLAPRGFVADYVPFYFAPRSPMLFAIQKGKVRTYRDGQSKFVYLVTDVARLTRSGRPFLFTDRNASLKTATFESDLQRLPELVDLKLMAAKMWNSTPEEPDRKERRMAELLVHQRLPFSAVTSIGVQSQEIAQTVSAAFGTMTNPPIVQIQPGWYF